jgi:hypothetical protein
MVDGKLESYVLIPSTTKPDETARRSMDEAMGYLGIVSLEEIDYIVGTGYGRLKVPFANVNISRDHLPRPGGAVDALLGADGGVYRRAGLRCYP